MLKEEALNLVRQNIKRENLVKHMIAVGAIMRRVAEYLGENKQKWEIVGILHDLDFEKTDIKTHGLVSCEMLKGKVDDEILRAIKSHNFENTGVMPKTNLEKILVAADSISGLIVACALVMPSKKLSEVKLKTIKKKFKQKDFARNCSRERILFCEKVGIEREKFFELSLEGLKEIAEELGL